MKGEPSDPEVFRPDDDDDYLYYGKRPLCVSVDGRVQIYLVGQSVLMNDIIDIAIAIGIALTIALALPLSVYNIKANSIVHSPVLSVA